MPPLLNSNAVIQCAHGGKYSIIPKGPRPMVAGGMGVLEIDLAPGPPAAGCTFNIAGAPAPCIPLKVAAGLSTKVLYNGMPLLTQMVTVMASPPSAPPVSLPCASAGQVQVQANG